MDYKQIFQLHQQTMFRQAAAILPGEALAEQAVASVHQVLYENRRLLSQAAYPTTLLAVILAKQAAVRLYDAGREEGALPFEKRGWDYALRTQEPESVETLTESDILMLCLPQKSLDLLLLCSGRTFTAQEAAQLLQIPEEDAQRSLQKAKAQLCQLLVDDETPKIKEELEAEAAQAIETMREYIFAACIQPAPSHTFSEGFLKNIKNRESRLAGMRFRQLLRGVWQNSGVRLALFLAAGAALVLSCFSIFTALHEKELGRPGASWDQRFQEMGVGEYLPQDVLDQAGADVSLYDLSYELTFLPEDFRRAEHYFGKTVSHVTYLNDADQRILFSQQISKDPVVGFDTSGGSLEIISQDGREMAFKSELGLQKVFWYNGRYCYILSTNLSKETALNIARSASMKAKPFPTLQKIPLEYLPEKYTPHLARENGDVIRSSSGPPENELRLRGFVQNAQQKKDDAVRLTSFDGNQIATVADLQMQNGHLYYTLDAHRDPSAKFPAQMGEEYDRVVLERQGAQTVLLLYSLQYDSPLEVMRFSS